MVKILIGDLFESSTQTLVNTVNCVGVMGDAIPQELMPDFFSQKTEISNKTKKFYKNRINPAWVALVDILRRLEEQPFHS